MSDSRQKSKRFSSTKKIAQHLSNNMLVAGMVHAIREVIPYEKDNPFLNWAIFGPFLIVIEASYEMLWVFSFKKNPLEQLRRLTEGTGKSFLLKLGRRIGIKLINEFASSRF